MFFDGVTYAAVAHNWSEEVGEFWLPFYHHRDAPFVAHPPLLYVLLGSFYKVLGDAWWVEEFYNFITYIATLVLSIAIFQKVSYHSTKIAFLPVFLLAVTPLYSWAFRATLMDNTVAVFTLLTVYVWLIYLQTSYIYFLVLGTLFLFFGFLVKGPPALFPMIFFPAYTLLFQPKNFKYWFISFLPLLMFAIMLGLMMILSTKAAHFFDVYFSKQVIASIQGIETSANGRFYILKKLLLELIPMSLLSGLFIFGGRKKIKSFPNRWVALFLIVAIAASLPLVISHKQRAFYLVPSFPFFSIALSLIIAPFLDGFTQSMNKKVINITGIILFFLSIISVSSSLITRHFFSKDTALIDDILEITRQVKPYSTIQCSSATAMNWIWVAYAARYGGYTLDDQHDATYYLCMPGEMLENDFNWQPVNIELTRCKLYKKREPKGSLLPRPE